MDKNDAMAAVVATTRPEPKQALRAPKLELAPFFCSSRNNHRTRSLSDAMLEIMDIRADEHIAERGMPTHVFCTSPL